MLNSKNKQQNKEIDTKHKNLLTMATFSCNICINTPS